MDKGPWTVTAGDITGKIRIDSDDFTHDASLIVYGDFADDDKRIAYARFIANELNSCASLRSRVAALEKVAEAAKVFAGFACDPPCGCYNCILRAEMERLKKITHISIPTETMEHEFQTYYRRGYEAGQAALRARVEGLEKELEKIAYPIRHLQIEADKEGAQLNGSVAIQLSDDPSWLKGIARAALDAKEG